MQQPELIVIAMNVVIVLAAYLLVYPRYCGADAYKIALNDFIATVISLGLAASMFWGSDVAFNAILGELNWFWFTLVTFLFLEIPFMLWYYTKHKIWQQF